MQVRVGLMLIGSLAVTAAVAACGSSGSDMNVNMKGTATSVKPDQSITLQAKNVRFVPDKLTIRMGSVIELKLENLDATEHDFQVDGLDADVMSGGSMNAEHSGGQSGAAMVAVHTMANEKGSVVFMANKKGAYNFYCTSPGHKEAGMVGTLAVE